MTTVHSIYVAVHNWLIANPLWCMFVLVPLFSALLYYVIGILRNFFKVQPQKLNIWILKARLLRAQSNLAAFQRLRIDTHYLVYRCFYTLFTSLAGLIFLSLSVALMTELIDIHLKVNMLPHQHAGIGPGLMAMVSLCISCICVLSGLFGVSKIAAAVRDDPGRAEELKKRVETLTRRLAAHE